MCSCVNVGQQSDCSSKTKINCSFYLYFRKKCQKSGQNQRQKQLFSVEYTAIEFGARVHEPWEISGNLGILRLQRLKICKIKSGNTYSFHLWESIIPRSWKFLRPLGTFLRQNVLGKILGCFWARNVAKVLDSSVELKNSGDLMNCRRFCVGWRVKSFFLEIVTAVTNYLKLLRYQMCDKIQTIKVPILVRILRY